MVGRHRQQWEKLEELERRRNVLGEWRDGEE